MVIIIFTVPTLIIIVVIRTLVRPKICFEFGLSINCRPSPLPSLYALKGLCLEF